MEELNTTQSVEMIEQDSFDTLTVVDMGDAIALSQVDEDGELHDIILGHDQLDALMKIGSRVLG